MRELEGMEDEALLATVDKYCSYASLNPFERDSKNFDAKIISEKMTIDKLIGQYPNSIAPKCIAILDALVYKMSAPFRHAKFWRYTRRVLKELKKLNALKLVTYLKNVSKIEPNLLLLALNAEIHAALKEDMKGIMNCYSCLLPLLTDSSLLDAERLLETRIDTRENSIFAITSLDYFRPVAELCGIDESEYIDLLAITTCRKKERNSELQLSDFSELLGSDSKLLSEYVNQQKQRKRLNRHKPKNSTVDR